MVNPPGVDLPDLTGHQRVDLSPKRVELLTVGRLVPWKGIDVALRALTRSGSIPGSTMSWAMGNLVWPGRQWAAELGIEDRVFFRGYQENLSAWYKKADLFLFPSRCEGFGIGRFGLHEFRRSMPGDTRRRAELHKR